MAEERIEKSVGGGARPGKSSAQPAGGKAGAPSQAARARALGPAPLRWLTLSYATGFGAGFSPIASGTAGSLVGVALFWSMAPRHGTWGAYLAALALLIATAILVSTAAEEIYGKKDDGRIVIDEVVGFLVTMLWVPRGVWTVVIGFLAFRFFDIVKPPPIRRLESLPAGTGIVADDLMAGVYACFVVHVLIGIRAALAL